MPKSNELKIFFKGGLTNQNFKIYNFETKYSIDYYKFVK